MMNTVKQFILFFVCLACVATSSAQGNDPYSGIWIGPTFTAPIYDINLGAEVVSAGKSLGVSRQIVLRITKTGDKYQIQEKDVNLMYPSDTRYSEDEITVTNVTDDALYFETKSAKRPMWDPNKLKKDKLVIGYYNQTIRYYKLTPSNGALIRERFKTIDYDFDLNYNLIKEDIKEDLNPKPEHFHSEW
ncbi:MAG: hypothetical protein IJG81_10735 [Muribaculaceae bacterium]|nr:hypothetical protein [Muribaculaceae bacterium]